MEDAKTKAPKAKKYVLKNTLEGGWVEIPGLGFNVTPANVNNPRVIAAILNAERRLDTKIFGVNIVLE